MTKPNSTEIIFVLDRSGSMSAIRTDMEGGFNQLIKDQRAIPGDCKVTLTQFDTVYEIVYEGVPLADVKPLELVPRGSTALLDAIGRTIDVTGARFANLPESERPASVIFVIVTDGQENASREYNKARVFDLIKTQRERYKWQFVFIGADQDAIAVAHDMGIAMAANSTSDPHGTRRVYSSVSSSIGAARGSGQAMTYGQIDYDADANKPKSN